MTVTGLQSVTPPAVVWEPPSLWSRFYRETAEILWHPPLRLAKTRPPIRVILKWVWYYLATKINGAPIPARARQSRLIIMGGASVRFKYCWINCRTRLRTATFSSPFSFGLSRYVRYNYNLGETNQSIAIFVRTVLAAKNCTPDDWDYGCQENR